MNMTNSKSHYVNVRCALAECCFILGCVNKNAHRAPLGYLLGVLYLESGPWRNTLHGSVAGAVIHIMGCDTICDVETGLDDCVAAVTATVAAY